MEEKQDIWNIEATKSIFGVLVLSRTSQYELLPYLIFTIFQNILTILMSLNSLFDPFAGSPFRDHRALRCLIMEFLYEATSLNRFSWAETVISFIQYVEILSIKKSSLLLNLCRHAFIPWSRIKLELYGKISKVLQFQKFSAVKAMAVTSHFILYYIFKRVLTDLAAVETITVAQCYNRKSR